VSSALVRAGCAPVISTDGAEVRDAPLAVIAGVGHLESAARGLARHRLDEAIAERFAAQRPVLGICVGMQVLFARGVEHGVETDGCDEWPGLVERLQAPIVPHMGWNTVAAPVGSALFAGIADARFYFVHSYGVAAPIELAGYRVATAEHGTSFVAAVESPLLSATQFHPEKSGAVGIQLLRNWLATLPGNEAARSAEVGPLRSVR
jgi:imidazole glycerol-phosphate synthase subunit HisH